MALAACFGLIMLAACNSAGSQVAPSTAMQQNAIRLGLNAVPASSIVYTHVNKKIMNGGTLSLDLNNDRTADFTFKQSYARFYIFQTMQQCGAIGALSIIPRQAANGVVGGAYSGWAAVLNKGERVRSKVSFDTSVSVMTSYAYGCAPGHYNYGYWNEKFDKYLGLEFQIQGQTYYGWAQMSVSEDRSDMATMLTGYTYETIAGKLIRAGQKK